MEVGLYRASNVDMKTDELVLKMVNWPSSLTNSQRGKCSLRM